MSTYTTDKASPFTRAVVRSMRKLLVTSRKKNAASRGLSILIRYPEALAEGFDNTGCRYRRLILDYTNMPAD